MDVLGSDPMARVHPFLAQATTASWLCLHVALSADRVDWSSRLGDAAERSGINDD